MEECCRKNITTCLLVSRSKMITDMLCMLGRVCPITEGMRADEAGSVFLPKWKDSKMWAKVKLGFVLCLLSSTVSLP